LRLAHGILSPPDDDNKLRPRLIGDADLRRRRDEDLRSARPRSMRSVIIIAANFAFSSTRRASSPARREDRDGEMSPGEEARVEWEREANVSAGVRGDSRLILDIVLELEVGRSGGDRGKSPHVGALAGIRSDCPDGPDRRHRSYLIACLEHL